MQVFNIDILKHIEYRTDAEQGNPPRNGVGNGSDSEIGDQWDQFHFD